jgi:hypothetical protein
MRSDFIESIKGDRDCGVYAGYNRAAVTVRSPPSLPPSRNEAANAVLLLHAILLMRTSEASLKIRTVRGSKQSLVTKTLSE